MRKLSIYFQFAALFTLLSFSAFAQNNMGHHTDNYSGVYSLSNNPAEIVDSRFKFHMNIIGLGTTFSNNYIGIKRTALFKDRDFSFDDPNFSDNYLVERLNGNNKKVYLSTDVIAPLSFMFNIDKKRNHAFGFNARLRVQTNANGVDENLATMAYNELLLSDLYNVGIQNKNFSIQTNVWEEYGLTYGTNIINKGKHFVSIAGTAKLTRGLSDVYFYSDNLDVTFPTDSTVSVTDTDIKFGYNSILGSDIENAEFQDFRKAKMGLGFDIGAVWEFRPNTDQYKYELDGNPDYLDPSKEKYKLKVGFSVMDIGYTKYERSNGVYGEYYANVADIDIEDKFGAAFDEFGSSGLQAFQDTLASLFDEQQAEKETYRVSLPMRINTFVDYNIWKGFYANFSASIAPGFKKNPEKTRSISEFALTPRFEHRFFSFYLPVSVNTHGNFHLGTGMRIGPLAFGTNDILPLVGKKEIYDANVYVNLSIPICKKIRDKDKDHVSNKKDDCKKEPGPWANMGCPANDADDDGIIDEEDDCPKVAGLAEFNGCPDTDEDGIIDSKDDCPEIAGLEEFNGCPDADEDGVKDEDDDCPEVAGLIELNGCPDTDGDGVKDADDKCPEEAGTPENNGCPYADSDKDGVIDIEDECPQTAGPASNKGCPVIDKEVEEAIDLAFKNLEFETGKAVIRKSSYTSLENLAEILKTHPDYKLLIEGHTDSVGDEASNMTLSQKRADAVKTKLIEKGVDAASITTKAYGETQPIDTNDTAEGRQNNRRVELTIEFD